MKTFQQENNELLNSFLKRTFLGNWGQGGLANFGSLELQIGTVCNLKCKYCYYARYGRQLYPVEIQKPEEIFNNLDIVLNWLIKNRFSPKIEVFSGDPLIQELGLRCIKLIIDKLHAAKLKIPALVIPTNYTFLTSEKQTEKIEQLLAYGKKYGLNIVLSASFDGKYCEANRPMRVGKDPRDDAYYDRCFAFNKKTGFGFHPMVYSELIEQWPKNFLWFQKNFKKFGIPFNNIYLLEVRNAEWSDRQIKKFVDFIDFLIDWTYKVQFKGNADRFMEFIFRQKGYNILSNAVINIGRGLGCSIQQTMHIRLGDLTIVPCHRTSYPPYIIGKFAVKNGEIAGIESVNPEIMIGEITFEGRNWPTCESCLLKYSCIRGCLGSQFETTGDLFSPIPTVCKLSHAKLYAIIRAFKRLGVYGRFYEKVDDDKKAAFDIFEKLIK